MAEDLGQLDISIKVDERQVERAFGGGAGGGPGGGGGSLAAGAVAGGAIAARRGTAAARVGAGATGASGSLAAIATGPIGVIAVAVGALVLLVRGIKKTNERLASETKRLAAFNPGLAGVAAASTIGQLQRDVERGRFLEASLAEGELRRERIRDAVAPLRNVRDLVQSEALNEIITIVEGMSNMLTRVTSTVTSASPEAIREAFRIQVLQFEATNAFGAFLRWVKSFATTDDMNKAKAANDQFMRDIRGLTLGEFQPDPAFKIPPLTPPLPRNPSAVP